uniref:ATP synthase complex subunit 8 n=1 Tax=Trigonopterus jasminae TaxID=2576128 RepID=A0A7H1KHU3_9CUCU|nr:ATP synthase F0 subunit 8 [Trigonopterus jasminae]QNT26859.1 ATP synthase F0 subunit 8 [Trigonopterus jasminae]
MPQMAPINWTLLYILIIFLFLTLVILSSYLFSYKPASYRALTKNNFKFWK